LYSRCGVCGVYDVGIAIVVYVGAEEMIQLGLHLIGDYIIQNDWMALNKKLITLRGELACQIHCISYALLFLVIGSWKAVLVIYITHYILDRTNIVVKALAIRNGIKSTKNFGFGLRRPFAISIWLYIITDNTIHLILNWLALKFL
jgi:hypothetical protein